mmetsp:Transcript_4052/g.6284  ORF Transcript_4052/g.6284 Transcript_4052/m.6284 type:complete len:91 (-) Transcript_4052:517-789(-)
MSVRFVYVCFFCLFSVFLIFFFFYFFGFVYVWCCCLVCFFFFWFFFFLTKTVPATNGSNERKSEINRTQSNGPKAVSKPERKKKETKRKE